MDSAREWDVIVVGAGLGGLTAAARLLREGLRVLVLEAGTHPGGTAYYYPRGGYLFPMGPLGFARPELVAAVFSRVGVKEFPSLQRIHYRLRAFGLSVPLSLPFQDMVRELSALFPHEAEGIARFFSHMASLSRVPGASANVPLPVSMPHGEIRSERVCERRADNGPCAGPEPPQSGGKESTRSPLADASASAAHYLENITRDWRLRRILGSTGTREPYTGLGLLAAAWYLLCESGIYQPPGGTRALCDLLAALFGWDGAVGRQGDERSLPAKRGGGPRGPATPVSAHRKARPAPGTAKGIHRSTDLPNGMLLLRRRVSRILVERGRAQGVITAEGNIYHAPAIVSNADFKQAFLRLLRPGDIPEELARAVRDAGQTPSNLQVCLGFDAGRVDLSAFQDAQHIIYRRADGARPPRDGVPDWSLPEVDPRDLAAGELEVALLGIDDPTLAPPGKAVLVIRTPAAHSHFMPFRPSSGARSGGYQEYKKRLGLGLLAEVSGFLPGLRDSVEVMDVATPLTFEERGGRSEGAVAGWSWDFRDNPRGEARELVRTPIHGLFMAGYQAFSMLALGGIPSAVLAGLLAAEYVLAGAGPAECMEIPAGH